MNRRQRIAAINIMIKQADSGIVNFLVQALTPMFNSIKNDPIGGIGQLLLEGVIFSSCFGWIGAIVVTVLDMVFGINVRTLLDTIKRIIVPFMQEHQGQPVDIDSASEHLSTQVMSSVGMNSTDANKTFDQITEENPGIKLAANLLVNRYGIVKEAGLLGILKNLTMGGFIKSLIKSLFIGAGFSAASSTVKNIFTGTSDQNKDITQSHESNKTDPEKSILKYVGRPTNSSESMKKYNNDADKDEKSGEAFYIISNGSFERMMYELVKETYPRMPENVADVIERNFDKVIYQIKEKFIEWNKEDIDQPGTYVRVPTEIGGFPLNSFKNIADVILSMFAIK